MHSMERHTTRLYGSCSGAHDVPWDVKSASLDQFFPPWTVRRQVWSDSLKQQHSGISTDILLFSDINLSLIHHYRIHKRGLLHVAFRRTYMSQLRAFCLCWWLILRRVYCRQFRSALDRCVRQALLSSAKRRMRPIRVVETSVCDLPVLMLQDPSHAPGVVVYDCRPPLLPVSLGLSGIDPLSVLSPVVSASVTAIEDGLTMN